MGKLILSLILLTSLFTMLWATGMADPRIMRFDESISQNFRHSFRMPRTFSPETNRSHAISEIEKEVLNGWTGQFYAIENLVVGYTSQMQPNSYILSFYDDAVREWFLVYKQEVFYHDNGKPNVTYYSNWDRNAEKWMYAGAVECEYYPDCRIRLVTQSEVNNPEPVSIAEFVYNSQNRIDQVIKTSIVDMNTYMTRDRIFYDNRGRVSYTIYQEQDVNQHWVDIVKTVITYLPEDNSTYDDFANLFLLNLVWGMEIFNPYSNVFKLQREDYYFRNALDWDYGYYRTFAYNDAMQILDTTDWGDRTPFYRPVCNGEFALTL